MGARGEAHRRYGDLDFGLESDLDVLEHERRFIDRWMQDRDDGLADEPRVKVFLMGENRRLDLDDWPPREAEVQNWTLSASGHGHGRLALDPGRFEKVRQQRGTAGTACSMCGKYCAMDLVAQYLGVKAGKC